MALQTVEKYAIWWEGASKGTPATVVNSVYTVATPKVQNFNRVALQSGIVRLADSSFPALFPHSKTLPFNFLSRNNTMVQAPMLEILVTRLCLESHIRLCGQTLICTRRRKCRMRSRYTAKEWVCASLLRLKGNRRRRLLKCPMGRESAEMRPRLSKYLARALNAVFPKPMAWDNAGDFDFLSYSCLLYDPSKLELYLIRRQILWFIGHWRHSFRRWDKHDALVKRIRKW